MIARVFLALLMVMVPLLPLRAGGPLLIDRGVAALAAEMVPAACCTANGCCCEAGWCLCALRSVPERGPERVPDAPKPDGRERHRSDAMFAGGGVEAAAAAGEATAPRPRVWGERGVMTGAHQTARPTLCIWRT